MSSEAWSEASERGRPALRVERRAGCAVLTLDRPESLNSLGSPLVEALDEACAAIEDDPAVRGVLIRGSGRSFCAGGDLAEARRARASGPGGAGRYFATISAVLSRIERLPVPTVAVVHGWAVAGGLELVLCCDLVLAADTARFGDAHARCGLVPGGGGSVRLPRRIGVNRANWLTYTGESVSAATMQQWGLVAEVLPEGELWAGADRLAATLGRRSGAGLRAMKHLSDVGGRLAVDEALALEGAVCARHAESADAAEGFAAFADKREPGFAS
ncbi:enoyl-CoA hydratase/isomerase family protein [Actinomycetospora straminea]|uniref:Enoyl-CoA hydratase/isomerase family protein n=1 Tax=Actinomycetospora straminea TaxID=663607 RepID=A0ABP9EJZ7_9PSEU|nr:enoyl-CoA hydratase-related protein [Actinomycetospora straminea]MDD7933799.1 enoyl-CoA hydratase-related protein [Actinomycetospora straminea]